MVSGFFKLCTTYKELKKNQYRSSNVKFPIKDKLLHDIFGADLQFKKLNKIIVKLIYSLFISEIKNNKNKY